MKSQLRPARLPRFGLLLGLLALLTGQANADVSLTVTGLYDGWNSPIVEIQYTGRNGYSTQASVYDDPQVVSGYHDSKGHSLPFYCVDLLHDNYLSVTYQAKIGPSPGFNNTSYADASNRVAWAIESAPLTVYGRAATQLLVWTITDKGFGVSDWRGQASLETVYDHLVTALGDPTKGYDPNKNYLGSVMFFNAVHDSNDTLFQSLACPVPEPSTLAIASLGALGLIGFGLRRRKGA